MADEIIDLTGFTPPPPTMTMSFEAPTPTILNSSASASASASAERIQFERAAMPLWACPNPNLRCTHQRGAPWPASRQAYERTPSVIRFQPSMHGDQVPTLLEPVPEPNPFLFPHGARLKEPWTAREHELFLMGLIKYGRGRWSKIARHFLWNKTPQQVQSYALSFFRHLPSTHLYSFRRRNTSHSAARDHMTRSRNLMAASASHSMPMMMANEPQPPPTLNLFPVEAPFFPVNPPAGEASSSTSYGLQMQTGGASTSTSMTTASGEVDLELRLG